MSSDGEDLPLDATGSLERPWSQPVSRTTTGWLQVDLEAPARVETVVLRFGRRFGLYPRQYRIDASPDGHTWTPVRDEPNGEAPLVAYAEDPTNLYVRIDLPRPGARHLRIVRTGDRGGREYDLWPSWHAWGVSNVEVYGRP